MLTDLLNLTTHAGALLLNEPVTHLPGDGRAEALNAHSSLCVLHCKAMIYFAFQFDTVNAAELLFVICS